MNIKGDGWNYLVNTSVAKYELSRSPFPDSYFYSILFFFSLIVNRTKNEGKFSERSGENKVYCF